MTYQQPAAVPSEPQPSASSVSVLAVLSIGLVWANSIAGILLGHLALAQIRRTGERGRELALAGLIVGYILTALGMMLFVTWLVFMFAVVTQAGPGQTFTSYRGR